MYEAKTHEDGMTPDEQAALTGADTHAHRAARACGLHVAAVGALWDMYGKSAGPMRNAAMLKLRPDVVYAYTTGGAGTRSMINLARDAGIEVIVRQASAFNQKEQPR